MRLGLFLGISGRVRGFGGIAVLGGGCGRVRMFPGGLVGVEVVGGGVERAVGGVIKRCLRCPSLGIGLMWAIIRSLSCWCCMTDLSYPSLDLD